MNEQKVDPTWHKFIDKRQIEALDATPFLSGCRNRSVQPKELRSFLIQHYHYSKHFTRFLCALLSNLTNDGDLQKLADNLFEEMGLGKVGEVPHSQIYREMLESLGIDPTEEAPNPATLELVNTMLYYCRSHDPMDGLGALCLGAEAIVPHLYTQIINGFLANGHSPNELSFFSIHVENDDEHAKTMKLIIERELSGDHHKMIRLVHAASSVIEKRRRFFEEISFRSAETTDCNQQTNRREPVYAI